MNETCCVKRESHYFRSYISPVLKNICDKSEITKDAKIHLNKSFIIIAKNISKISLKFAKNNNRKTVSQKNVLSAIGLFVIGDLYKNSVEEADKALYNYKQASSKKYGRNKKAEIIFPAFLCEKFLRDFNNNQIMIAKGAPIILAVVLEYICSQILECVRDNLYNEKRVRFQTIDIDIAIKNDTELSYLFKKNNIKFIKASIIPFIHPKLLIKIRQSNSNKKSKKSPPILRNIKKLQSHNYKLTLCKKPFVNLVKKIANNKFNANVRFGKNVNTVLQHVVEAYIIELLFKANLLTVHSERAKLLGSDVIFISQITQDMHYLKNNIHVLDIVKGEGEGEEVEEVEEVEEEEVEEVEEVEVVEEVGVVEVAEEVGVVEEAEGVGGWVSEGGDGVENL